MKHKHKQRVGSDEQIDDYAMVYSKAFKLLGEKIREAGIATPVIVKKKTVETAPSHLRRKKVIYAKRF